AGVHATRHVLDEAAEGAPAHRAHAVGGMQVEGAVEGHRDSFARGGRHRPRRSTLLAFTGGRLSTVVQRCSLCHTSSAVMRAGELVPGRSDIVSGWMCTHVGCGTSGALD